MNTIVTEKTEQGEIAVDVFQKLSSSRVLFITGIIDSDLAADISATLLLRDSEDQDNKITLFINSHGGNIRDVLAIYDMMTFVKAPIETICIGAAKKESIILLSAGTPGMRLATKNSILCAAQLGSDYMSDSDLTEADIYLKQSLDDNKRMMNIIAKTTRTPLKQVMKDFERPVFMSANEAIKYGFIDQVISPAGGKR